MWCRTYANSSDFVRVVLGGLTASRQTMDALFDAFQSELSQFAEAALKVNPTYVEQVTKWHMGVSDYSDKQIVFFTRCSGWLCNCWN